MFALRVLSFRLRLRLWFRIGVARIDISIGVCIERLPHWYLRATPAPPHLQCLAPVLAVPQERDPERQGALYARHRAALGRWRRLYSSLAFRRTEHTERTADGAGAARDADDVRDDVPPELRRPAGGRGHRVQPEAHQGERPCLRSANNDDGQLKLEAQAQSKERRPVCGGASWQQARGAREGGEERGHGGGGGVEVRGDVE